MNARKETTARLPVRRSLSFVYITSLVIAALMTTASMAGLLDQARVYPTDELIQSFLPNDVVNLLIGLPIMAGSMWLARRGLSAGCCSGGESRLAT